MTIPYIEANSPHISYYAIIKMICESQQLFKFPWLPSFLPSLISPSIGTVYTSHTYHILSSRWQNSPVIKQALLINSQINILTSAIAVNFLKPVQRVSNGIFLPKKIGKNEIESDPVRRSIAVTVSLQSLKHTDKPTAKSSVESETKNRQIALQLLRQVQKPTSKNSLESEINNLRMVLSLLKDPQKKVDQTVLRLLKSLQMIQNFHSSLKTGDPKKIDPDLAIKNLKMVLTLLKIPQKNEEQVDPAFKSQTGSLSLKKDDKPEQRVDVKKSLDAADQKSAKISPIIKNSIEKIPPVQLHLNQDKLPILSKELLSPVQTVVTTHNELTALMKPSLHLPLTFIVPFPFEHPISGSSHKTKKVVSKRKRQARENEEESQSMVLVPQGPLIVNGDSIEMEAFAIAVTPVTNAQFANWLNALFDTGQIVLNDGVICNLDGDLICFTQEKVATSQIQTSFHEGILQFKSTRHMDYHPVVHVTYLGATLFCRDQGVRLPTEYEWERAAGMTLPNAQCKKFIFGCSSDEMNTTLANYRDNFTSLKFSDNRTTPVGFYNGESLFSQLYKTLQTKIARSPFGCYDMSGNVGEWVAEKVSKGGSYNSPIEELKISSSMRLDPRGDAFTGFRVALSITP